MQNSLFSIFSVTMVFWLISPDHLAAGPNGPGGGPTVLECEEVRSGPFQVYTGAERACLLGEEEFKEDVLEASGCDANGNGIIDESEVQCVFEYLRDKIRPKDRKKGATKDEIWKWLEPFLKERGYWWPDLYLDGIMKYDCNRDGKLSEQEVKDMLRGKKCGAK